MILIDSSVWVEGLRRSGDTRIKLKLTNLLDDGSVLTCFPIRLEILGAARRSDRKTLDGYFKDIPNLEITEDVWNGAILLSRSLRDRGYAIPWNDILIAATALDYQVPVYSKDNHFKQIQRITKLKLS